MDTQKPGHVFVCSGGKIRTLYTDALPLKNIGAVAIKRASHVDATADLRDDALVCLFLDRNELFRESKQTDGFTPEQLAMIKENTPELACLPPMTATAESLRARFLPGPDAWWADLLPSNGPVLGPFESRQEALDAEVAWLRVHEFKVNDPA